ncbi:MAG: aspartate aminotransferase [Rhodospirillaceae bacterium]|nr:aspartate aminotransferase [Rhodospirillaceae bacterium]|tara:strand:+ start:7757 stop:8890 length:1134 start_codon:yes stop_codon:yes gene_type:complete
MSLENTQSFDRLHKSDEMLWMGQNTNHLPTHPVVKEALEKAIIDQSFNLYAPPQGMEELREMVLDDVVGKRRSKDTQVLITDGAVEGLYLVCKRLSGDGITLVTTDPTWVWPLKFSRNEGAEICRLPIYDREKNYKMCPDELEKQLSQCGNAIIYLIDPLNPLGCCYDLDELTRIADIAKKHDATVVHDCTYRDFAFDHHLVRDLYPEKTITTYSFSKWLGIAGLRTGAIIADEPLFSHLMDDQPNILGSNILGQLAAMSAFRVKEEWMENVNSVQRHNQASINNAIDMLEGLRTVVYPSNGNFLAVDCQECGISANAISEEFLRRQIFIRTSDYHSDTLKDIFLKISTTVPVDWADRFCEELPDIYNQLLGNAPPS